MDDKKERRADLNQQQQQTRDYVKEMVDRLEERGLAQRRTPPNDRRVKTVVLTPLGIRTRERLRESFYDPPAALMDLDVSSLKSLQNELRKLPAPPQGQGGVC